MSGNFLNELTQITQNVTNTAPFDSDLMYYVPDDVSAVTACNSGLKKVKKYVESDTIQELGKLLTDKGRLSNMIMPLVPDTEKDKAGELVNKTADIITMLLNTDLLKSAFYIKEYVQYQKSMPGMITPDYAGFAILDKELDFSKDFDAFSKAGFPVTKEESDGYTFWQMDYTKLVNDLIQMNIPPNAATGAFKMPDMKIWVSYSGNKLGVGSKKELILKFYKGEKFPNKPVLLSSESFKADLLKLNNDVPAADCQSYMDFARVMMDSMRSSLGSAATAEEIKNLTEKSPLSSLMQAISYGKSLNFSQQWNFKESAIPAEFNDWIPAIENAGEYEGISKIDANAALGLGVNAEIIKKLKAVADKKPEFAAQISMIPFADIITGLENISFAVSPASSAAIWPEGLLSLKLQKSKELYELAKVQILEGLNQSGMPIQKWLEKDVNGQKVEYFTTPFGIGLYLTEGSGNILAASSEAAISNFLKGDNTLIKKMNEKALFRTKNSLLEQYISFNNILTMVKTTQSSLAMFIGQAFNIPADTEVIARAFGHTYFSVKAAQKSLVFNFSQTPDEKAKN